MRRHLLRYLLPAVLVLSVVACSTEKDAFLNRTFHRLVSRDNGWFNANEKLKETVAAMQKAHEDDFDEVLPIFVYGTDEQAKAMVPELEVCIDKCAVVIDRNSMEIGGKERNTWIDDAWFVIGKSHFYKKSYYEASRTFEYIARRYKGQDKQLEAKLWVARTAIEMEQFAKAQSALDDVKKQKELPKGFPHDQLSAVEADLGLHRGKIDDAIISLEHAVQIASKKDRIRWTFILGQLYQLKGDDDKAIAQYTRVTRMGPPYEIGFHAEIFQALAFDRGSSKAIRQKLLRMLRDDKNLDHYDMIHYALADLDLKENQQDNAIAQLKESARTSTTDVRQKAKSFLKVADLYFDNKQYPFAQQYYDSTSAILDPANKRFDEVRVRADVLGDLVEQLKVIAREDSLQAFAALDLDERKKRVNRLIREREEVEAVNEQAASDAREVVASNAISPTVPGSTGAGGAWYFYNPVQIARGMSDFKKKWGTRGSDDDWRRSDKSGSALVDVAEQEEVEETELAMHEPGQPAWKDPSYYLKDIPDTPAKLDSSNSRICEALYLSGMIYKEKLKDIDNAIESFQVLNDRFDDCRFTPEANYQLYRIYLAKEAAGNFMDFGGASSKHYADLILERWPGSEFARLVRNPDQLQADESLRIEEAKAYETIYGLFRQGAYNGVIATCDGVIKNEPRNHLLAKYELLRAMAIGGLHLVGPFRDALIQVRDGFPGTDESKAAAELIANLDRRNSADKPAPAKAASPAYSTDAGEHFVILMLPDGAGDLGRIRSAISDFNLRNFKNIPIEVKTSMFDANTHVIMIRLFETKAKAMEYYDLFAANRTDLKGINDKGYPLFAITMGNYEKFYTAKDQDGYVAFFSQNYLDKK